MKISHIKHGCSLCGLSFYAALYMVLNVSPQSVCFLNSFCILCGFKYFAALYMCTFKCSEVIIAGR